jgi:hypothetical protein
VYGEGAEKFFAAPINHIAYSEVKIWLMGAAATHQGFSMHTHEGWVAIKFSPPHISISQRYHLIWGGENFMEIFHTKVSSYIV